MGAQMANVVGDLDGNAERIVTAMREAERAGADVVVFPELALTGYPLMDLVMREGVRGRGDRDPRRASPQPGAAAVVVGTITRVPPRRSWDVRDRDIPMAAVLCDGQLRGVYHKLMLPTSAAGRWSAPSFSAGRRPPG